MLFSHFDLAPSLIIQVNIETCRVWAQAANVFVFVFRKYLVQMDQHSQWGELSQSPVEIKLIWFSLSCLIPTSPVQSKKDQNRPVVTRPVTRQHGALQFIDAFLYWYDECNAIIKWCEENLHASVVSVPFADWLWEPECAVSFAHCALSVLIKAKVTSRDSVLTFVSSDRK